MNKMSKGLILLAFLVIIPSISIADVVTYQDNVINWPGWTPQYTDDQIGRPAVGAVQVTIDNGYLTSVKIDLSLRAQSPYWDSLFINTDWNGNYSDYQSWNYYVRDNTWNVNGDAVISGVDAQYAYALATQIDTWNGRWGHPAGIASGLIDPGNVTVTETYDSAVLTYTFTGFKIGDKYVIGFSEWCANDVFLTPVAEPMTMILLGLGLFGLAGVRRFK